MSCCTGNQMPCDLHEVPPVCVCETPHPQPRFLGECAVCKRPYKPEVPGFDACRAAWQRQMEGVS